MSASYDPRRKIGRPFVKRRRKSRAQSDAALAQRMAYQDEVLAGAERARQKRDLTQMEFCRLAGVMPHRYRDLLQARAMAHRATLAKIKQAAKRLQGTGGYM